MKYAVVQLQGKQYRVEEGQELLVDRLPLDEKKPLVMKEVLLFANNGAVQIGEPFVPGVSVKAVVLKHTKGEKIRVATFKAKSRYRKTRGHRQAQTVIQIEKIVA